MLAFACAFTMFAGAAFTDQSDIAVDSDVVDTLVALGVINGYEDGSFQPEVTVTRAEMAKMIFTILNGGNDDASAYENLPTSFTDLGQEAWAAGYIKYLQNSDIIAGKSATRFAPSDTVTGVEAAKMMLVAAGYSPDKAGLTGAAWVANTMRYANANDLFENVNCDVNSGLPRQYAAQIMYNSLDMENVVYSNDIEGFKPATDVSEDRTIGGKYMDLTTYEGMLLGCGEYGASNEKINLEVRKIDGRDYTDEKGNTSYTDSFNYAEDITDLVGQYVKVTTGKNEKVYGVFAVSSENTVVTAALSDIELVSGTKVKVDGTEYKYEADAYIYSTDADVVYAKISDLSTSAKNSADTITFISNDGDSTFDVAYINPIVSVSKVTYVSDDSFTAGDEYDYADVVAPSDLAKGDYVVKTTDLFTGNEKFVKADLVSGKITSTKGSGTYTDIKLSGSDEWYQVAAAQKISDKSIIGFSGDALARDNSYDLVVVNGVVYIADKTASGSSDTALVTGASTALDVDGNQQVKLLFADGSEKVVPADDDYTSMKTSDGTAFVTYETDDGVYTVTSVKNVNIVDTFGDGYTYGTGTGFDADKDRLDSKRVADDATIYVQYVDGDKDKTAVITGAELNAMGSDFGTNSYYVYSGTLITEALIVGSTYLPGASADKLYGYVTSSVTETSDDGTDYKEFTVWTSNNESIDVKMKGSAEVEKESLISFELAADNFIEGVKVLNAQIGAIKSFGSDYVILYDDKEATTTDYDLDDDVKFLYLNTADVKGVNGGELTEANETENADEYYANIKYYTEGTGDDEKIVMIAIDVTRNQYSVDGNVDRVVNKAN